MVDFRYSDIEITQFSDLNWTCISFLHHVQWILTKGHYPPIAVRSAITHIKLQDMDIRELAHAVAQ